MASMKMCKPAHETGAHCGSNQATVTAGQARPCEPCGTHAPEKKHHFWHRSHNEQSHGNAHAHAHGGNKITQCFGAAYGVKPPHHAAPASKPLHHAAASHGPHGAFACSETDRIEIVRVEKKEEHVSIVRVKNKSRANKSGDCQCSDSSGSDSESDNEGKGRRKRC